MKNRLTRSSVIVISFLLCLYFPRILKSFFDLKGNKLYISSLGYPFTLLIIIISLFILYKYSLSKTVSGLGLKKGFKKGLIFGLAAASPMIISSAIFFKLSENLFSFETLIIVIIGPVMEEILFRGYLFGQLFKKEHWGFIPASLVAAVFFGIGHLYQGDTTASLIGVFFVTFIGSVWNGWLYIEHNDNLWIPIWLHIFMNMSWSIFQTDVPGAIGNNITNLFRIITIVITVVYTIRFSKKNGFKINKKKLWKNKPPAQ